MRVDCNCIYPKYMDTSTPYYSSKILTNTVYYQTLCLKIAGLVANSVDLDETPYFVVSDLDLHCLHRPVCRIHSVSIVDAVCIFKKVILFCI